MKKEMIAFSIMLLMATAITVTPMPLAQEKEDLTFSFAYPMELPLWERVLEIFKSSCDDIGVKIEIQPLETGAWIDIMTETHDFDLVMCGMLMEPTPSYLPSMFHSKYSEAGFNSAGVEDSELDAILDSSMTTTDPTELKDLIFQIQEMIAQNLYCIPVFSKEIVYGYSSGFTGFVGMPGGVVNTWTYLGVHPVGEEYGGSLTIGMTGDIKTQNPLLRTLALESYIDDTIYDTLIRFAPDLSFVPCLAKSWEVGEDEKTWTFYLVDNATWHDGVPFTARDVKFTIDTVLENEPPTWYSYFEPIDSVEVIDDYTIQIHTAEPYAWMMTTFATFPPLPEHLWSSISWDEPYPPMVGTGPFKWVKYVRGEYIELEKNPDYWRKGKPLLDKILWKVYASAPAQVLALQAGESNLMYRYIPPETVKTLIKDPNVGIGLAPGLNFRYFIPNLRRPPFDDINLRKALAYAVDKDTVVNSLLLGYGMQIDSFVPESWGIWNNPDVTTYEYDLAKANEILDAAGYIDVDNDGVRDMPGTSPPPPPTPTWVWIAIGVIVAAVVSGGTVYGISRRRT